MKSWAYAVTNEEWREIGRFSVPWVALFVIVGGWVMLDTIRSGKPKPPGHDIRISQNPDPAVNVQANRADP